MTAPKNNLAALLVIEEPRVEHLSQWAAVQEAFSEPDVVERIFPVLPRVRALVPRIGVAGLGGRCPWCAREVSPLSPRFPVLRRAALPLPGPRRSRRRVDNFAACIANLGDFTELDGTPTVHIVGDRVMTWIPANYEDRQLPFPDIQAELAQVISRFPHMKQFSYEQFGALATIRGIKDLLKLARVKVPVRKLLLHDLGPRAGRDREGSPRQQLDPLPTRRVRPQRNLPARAGDEVPAAPKPSPHQAHDRASANGRSLDVPFNRYVGAPEGPYGRRVREALSGAPLLPGLPGGYHTSGPSEPGSAATPRVAPTSGHA
jgi:hypothetical protein